MLFKCFANIRAISVLSLRIMIVDIYLLFQKIISESLPTTVEFTDFIFSTDFKKLHEECLLLKNVNSIRVCK